MFYIWENSFSPTYLVVEHKPSHNNLPISIIKADSGSGDFKKLNV